MRSPIPSWALTHPTTRADVVDRLASELCEVRLDHPVRVAIDGLVASGKSTLAVELADTLERRGRHAIALSQDDFHHPRAHRYRKGRLSSVGYYEDAFDTEALIRSVLQPLGPGGTLRYLARSFDLHADVAVRPHWVLAPKDAVLLVDGTFLQRRELRDWWDRCVYVRVHPETARRRGLRRDSTALGGEGPAAIAYDSRYLPASRLYLETDVPESRAWRVFDNEDPSHPLLVPGVGPPG